MGLFLPLGTPVLRHLMSSVFRAAVQFFTEYSGGVQIQPLALHLRDQTKTWCSDSTRSASVVCSPVEGGLLPLPSPPLSL